MAWVAILALATSAAQAAEIGAILQGTPLWVYPLLGLLIYLGLQARRERVARPLRLLITPAVFIGWGIVGVLVKPGFGPVLALDWLGAAAAGMALAAASLDTSRWRVEGGLVRLPGSWFPLIRNLAIFAAKYALAVAAATLPGRRGSLVLWDVAVSGASVGYFAFWLVQLARLYRRSAPVADQPKDRIAEAGDSA
ncbi:MAG: hypothetical protein HYR63_22540 [Proteobacteria bacterium]|nr:hypothetical protein [Pseudomonadota bacterium]MBI3497628.1 hypothetical protein [Pseudomonadota bacterium]